MTQPVRLSAALVEQARETADVMERSIAGQIEYWARLGRAIERGLRVEQAQALKKRGDLATLMTSLADSDANRDKVTAYLATRPFPHFEAAPDGQLVKVDEDGTRTLGKLVGRSFEASTDAAPVTPRRLRTSKK